MIAAVASAWNILRPRISIEEPAGAENSRNLAGLHRRAGRRIAIPPRVTSRAWLPRSRKMVSVIRRRFEWRRKTLPTRHDGLCPGAATSGLLSYFRSAPTPDDGNHRALRLRRHRKFRAVPLSRSD